MPQRELGLVDESGGRDEQADGAKHGGETAATHRVALDRPGDEARDIGSRCGGHPVVRERANILAAEDTLRTGEREHGQWRKRERREERQGGGKLQIEVAAIAGIRLTG